MPLGRKSPAEGRRKELTLKYALLRTELKRQHAGFETEQVNIVIDALCWYSKGISIGNHMFSSAIWNK